MGFVKISDDLPNWAWYSDNNTLLVYIRLLLGAVWRDTPYQNITLQRGQSDSQNNLEIQHCHVD